MEQTRPRVLVVEDEPLVRMGIADFLEDSGFEVFEAGNADQAIAVLVENRDIRVMFTDIDMPGSMDGLKLAAVVRDRWPPIKIIVTSGYRIVNSDELPVDTQFLPKPYDPELVSQTMHRLAGQD
jgi:CheY-like chemotaxis protein